jgi:dCMP deaminase
MKKVLYTGAIQRSKPEKPMSPTPQPNGAEQLSRNKIDYYLRIAHTVSTNSKCSRRKFGAILVKDDVILSTGYNGSVRGSLNCGTEIKCLKDLHNEPAYTSYEYCPAVHAEVNAVINAGRERARGSTLFLAELSGGSQRPCVNCRRVLIQAGVYDCYNFVKDEIHHELVSKWINMEDKWMSDKK